MQKKYENYFKDHYKLSFSNKDLESSHNWLYPQWKLIEKVVNMKNKHMLEIGSGFGGFYNMLTKYADYKEYVGLELDDQAVKFANKFFKTDVFINQSIESYKFKKKFDQVFAFEVLEHLEDPYVVITKIKESLISGGCFIGTSPFPYPKNIFADVTHRYVLHPKNWEKLFSDAGFKRVETLPMSFVPYIWRFSKYINIRLPFYVPIKNVISTSLIIAFK